MTRNDDHPADPWETICADHGGVCCHETRAMAERFVSHPEEWCEACMNGGEWPKDPWDEEA